MAMKIQYQLNTLLLTDLFNVILNNENFRLFILVSLQPAPIKVIACEVSTIVAKHNSVDIYHRKDIDIESPC